MNKNDSDIIDISVIIPSYNQKQFIGKALRSVLAQKTQFRYEVIVVDSSSDDTANFVQKNFPRVRLVKLKERAYPGMGRNYGIKEARGNIIALTDTDCIVAEDWLENIGRNQLAGRMSVGGPVGNGTPGSIAGNIEYILEFNEFLPTRCLMEVTLLPTCNMSYHKKIFEKYGLFENTIKSSDALYCRQLIARGEKIFLDPNIKMVHLNRTKLKKAFKNQYNLGTGAALIRKKMTISGSILVRFPFLALSIPFLRTFAIAVRLLKRSPAYFIKFWLLYFLIFPALVVFTAGFFKGLKLAALENKVPGNS